MHHPEAPWTESHCLVSLECLLAIATGHPWLCSWNAWTGWSWTQTLWKKIFTRALWSNWTCEDTKKPFAVLFQYRPLQDISVVVCQVTSANELWDLNGFCHSWAEQTVYLHHFNTRWQHQNVLYLQTQTTVTECRTVGGELWGGYVKIIMMMCTFLISAFFEFTEEENLLFKQ